VRRIPREVSRRSGKVGEEGSFDVGKEGRS
jgi:hypothetical protein